jgi:hypothetical protein
MSGKSRYQEHVNSRVSQTRIGFTVISAFSF